MKRLHSKRKREGQNVAAKGSRTITSLFPQASIASTPSSPNQLIENEIKQLFIPLKTFSFVFLSNKPI